MWLKMLPLLQICIKLDGHPLATDRKMLMQIFFIVLPCDKDTNLYRLLHPIILSDYPQCSAAFMSFREGRLHPKSNIGEPGYHLRRSNLR